MKYGICTSAEVAARAKECGYDYIESALQVVASLSEEDFNTYVDTMNAADMKCLAMCGFFPGTLKLVGDEADFEKIECPVYDKYRNNFNLLHNIYYFYYYKFILSKENYCSIYFFII